MWGELFCIISVERVKNRLEPGTPSLLARLTIVRMAYAWIGFIDRSDSVLFDDTSRCTGHRIVIFSRWGSITTSWCSIQPFPKTRSSIWPGITYAYALFTSPSISITKEAIWWMTTGFLETVNCSNGLALTLISLALTFLANRSEMAAYTRHPESQNARIKSYSFPERLESPSS